MKKLYSSLFLVLSAAYSFAQCTLTANIVNAFPSCANPCNGSAFCIAGGGTPPYTYLWTPTGQTTPMASGLCAGVYSCTVSDAAPGCPPATAVVTITQLPAYIISTSSTQTSTCAACNGTAVATASGSGSPFSYSWSTVPVQTAPTATGLCTGVYTVTVTNTQGCIQTATVAVTCPVGISAVQGAEGVKLFPNPSNGKFTLTGVTKGELEIYNVLGEKVHSSALTNTIDLSAQANGIYFVRVVGDKESFTQKVVIQK